MIATRILPETVTRPKKDESVLAGKGKGKPRKRILNVRVDDDFMSALDEAVRLHADATGEDIRKSDLVRIAVANFLGIDGVSTTTKESRQPSLPLGATATKKP